MSYSGGKVTLVDWVNSDEISFSDLEGIVYDLGYKDKMEMYYKYPGSQAFKEIKSNQEIVEMFDVFRRIRTVNIYICEVNLVALKVLHPGDEEYSDWVRTVVLMSSVRKRKKWSLVRKKWKKWSLLAKKWKK